MPVAVTADKHDIADAKIACAWLLPQVIVRKKLEPKMDCPLYNQGIYGLDRMAQAS